MFWWLTKASIYKLSINNEYENTGRQFTYYANTGSLFTSAEHRVVLNFDALMAYKNINLQVIKTDMKYPGKQQFTNYSANTGSLFTSAEHKIILNFFVLMAYKCINLQVIAK